MQCGPISVCMCAQSCLTLWPGSCVHGIDRDEYWSELPFPAPGDLPDPGIEPTPPALAG